MKARIALFAVAAIVVFGGVTVAAFAISPSCPSGSYRNGHPLSNPSQTGTIPFPPCTSYATHVAPSSGVVIPRYATYLDSHIAERAEIGVASLLLGACLAGLAFALGRRRRTVAPLSVSSV